MIGNDVIDLPYAKKENNWQRKGYLDKIFTAQEQKWILGSKESDVMVWLLWSKKEAVYKIINREKNITAFNPRQLECISIDVAHSLVRFQDQYYFTKSSISNSKVETIAAMNFCDFKNIIIIPNRDSIYKIDHLPFYKDRPASISHHGRFEQCIGLR